ncbi:hypothetical protein Q0590_32600 [Rhodocytophaga aerolata]|uniref:ParA family protein n=1 Tax=Rhodocytophaga aerolata TaxID=455078 RepID=A0ABT8RJG8_9BACT|nr:hypothetical protein [Rhodocytophaga aerolata]MDO1451060.1 hypothetical protein [Rhodocytophaga aerolata]
METTVIASKQIILSTQAKGGSGKTAVSTFIAGENQTAQIADFDTFCRSISTILPFRNPMIFSLHNKNGIYDKSRILQFFQEVEQSTLDYFICDLSSRDSCEIPFYLPANDGVIMEYLKLADIQLCFAVVIAGGNMFTSCLEYLKSIHKTYKGGSIILAYKNLFFEFSNNQSLALSRFCEDNSILLKHLPVLN